MRMEKRLDERIAKFHQEWDIFCEGEPMCKNPTTWTKPLFEAPVAMLELPVLTTPKLIIPPPIIRPPIED